MTSLLCVFGIYWQSTKSNSWGYFFKPGKAKTLNDHFTQERAIPRNFHDHYGLKKERGHCHANYHDRRRWDGKLLQGRAADGTEGSLSF